MSGDYKISVNGKTYRIFVEGLLGTDLRVGSNRVENDCYEMNSLPTEKGDSSQNKASKDVEISILFEAVKSEYEHSIKRSEKLDNKVYILITVCAFLFVMLSDIINSISSIVFPTTNFELALIILFFVLMASCVLGFTTLLNNLAGLLKPVLLGRLRSKRILNDDLVTLPPETSFRTICLLYEHSIKANDDVLERRFRQFHLCVNMMIFVICDLLAIAILRQFM